MAPSHGSLPLPWHCKSANPAMAPGTLPWHPTMSPSNGTAMAPYHVTQQWHCHGTQQWHPAVAALPSNGTQQWHTALASGNGTLPSNGTQQWHTAMAHGNGTWQWRPTMAPRPVRQAMAPYPVPHHGAQQWHPACHVQSAKVVRRPPLLLEVRTPIAKAIWGKIQLVSSQLLSVSYLPVQWVQSYHPSCLAFQNLDCNLILDARYLTTLKVSARMRQMNTKLDANGKNFAKPPFSALLNKYPSPLFPHSVMFHGNLPNPNHSWNSFNISSQSLGHRFYRPWRELAFWYEWNVVKRVRSHWSLNWTS